MDELAESRNGLQQQVVELAKSRDMLKQYAAALTGLRDDLRRQVGELTCSRDAAVVNAGEAKTKVKEMTSQLQKHIERIVELQNRVRMVQFSVDILELKLSRAPAKIG